MFLTVNLKIVAGRAESSSFKGMKGENAANSISTGRLFFLYSTNPMGYSPLNSMSPNSSFSRGRISSFPGSLSSTKKKPFLTGMLGRLHV